MNYHEELSMKKAAHSEELRGGIEMTAGGKLSDEQAKSLRAMLGYREEVESVLRQVESSGHIASLSLGGVKQGATEEGGAYLFKDDNPALQNVAHSLRYAASRLLIEELEKIAAEVRAIVR